MAAAVPKTKVEFFAEQFPDGEPIQQSSAEWAIRSLKADLGKVSEEQEGETHLFLGYLYSRLKDRPKALSHLLDANRILPNDIRVAINLGALLLKIGRPGDAAAIQQAALEGVPRQRTTKVCVLLSNLATALAAIGDEEQAVQALQYAEESIPPFSRFALLSFSESAAQLGYDRQALRTFARILDPTLDESPSRQQIDELVSGSDWNDPESWPHLSRCVQTHRAYLLAKVRQAQEPAPGLPADQEEAYEEHVLEVFDEMRPLRERAGG